MTVEGFIEKIVSQCKAVLDKHEKIVVDEYLKDGLYRTLEMEMLDVKVSASLLGERACADCIRFVRQGRGRTHLRN